MYGVQLHTQRGYKRNLDLIWRSPSEKKKDDDQNDDYIHIKKTERATGIAN